MSRYMQDPDNDNKQIPAPLPENAYERVTTPMPNSGSKTPNAVMIAKSPTNEIGFFFGSSASFAALSQAQQIDSRSYTVLANGSTLGGTILQIHPIAWSGSAADREDGNDSLVKFIYNSGLSTGGR